MTLPSHRSLSASLRWLHGLAMALGLVACAPALDWREVRAEGSELRAQLPCRPSRLQRPVHLAGQVRELQMLSCTAGESTWGLSWIEGVDPALIGDTLLELRRHAARNVGVAEGVLTALPVAGSTPNAQAGWTRVQGRRPDGSAVVLETAVFTRGTAVFQATVLGSRPAPQAQEQFFGALRFGG